MATSRRTNLLLSALPASALRKLLAEEDPVPLVLSDRLFERGQRARHVYFPIDAFVSLLTPGATQGSAALEVALVGNEGMVGSWLLLGVDAAPLRALVQGGGLAWRVDTKTFGREVAAGVEERVAQPLSFGGVVVVLTFLSLVLGELVPKRIALIDPDRIASAVAPTVAALSRAAHPIVSFLQICTEAILRVFGARSL